MVKKIRLIEEEETTEELDAKEFQTKLLDYLQAIDWKLWEMLKIEQAREDRDGFGETEEVKPKPKRKRKPTIKPIIVDEDDA